MSKLYVRDICVGNFNWTMDKLEIDLKQVIENENYSVMQTAYYLRSYADFFAIYSFYSDEEEHAEYIIDSDTFHPGYERYDAIELEPGTETKTIINLIKKSIAAIE